MKKHDFAWKLKVSTVLSGGLALLTAVLFFLYPRYS